MQRRNLAPTFLDDLTSDLGGPRAAEFFARIDKAVAWDKLVEAVGDLHPQKDPSQGGRPHWPVLTMIKCLLLAKWFGLSDPQLEENLRDRLSFRRFVGLSLADATPDETTFVYFRQRLREKGASQRVFEATLDCLREQHLLVKDGTLIDATIIQAPLGGKNPQGENTGDKLASNTYKQRRTYHGYKAFIAADKRGLVKDFVLDTAKVSDHAHADQLLAAEAKEAYADSGFRSRERCAQLEERGVFAGIAHRRVKGQKELTDEQKQFNRLVAKVRAIVEHPFAWLRKMNFWRARYRGLRRNGEDLIWRLIGYNWKRSLSLEPVLEAGTPSSPQS